MIAIIAFAVVFIFFCVLAFMASKTWLLRHVFLLFGVFLMTGVFLVLSAMLLKTQSKWRGDHARLTANLARTEKQIEDIAGPVGTPDEPSLPRLQADLSRFLLNRGRVWRGGVLAGAGDQGIDVNLANWTNEGCVRVGEDDLDPIPAEGDAAAPGPSLPDIRQNMVVHVFVDFPLTDLPDGVKTSLFGAQSDFPAEQVRQPCTVPGTYLGNFIVTQFAAPVANLQSVQPLNEEQLNRLNNGIVVTMYEVLPIDGHDVFEGFSEESLSSLFDVTGAPEGLSLAEYLRDGTEAQNDDPPERTWVKVKFLADYSIQVDVDAEAGERSDDFDVRGRAQRPALRLGSAAEFKTGDVAEFDAETANKLVQAGTCELVNEPSRYVRQLRDYELIFRQELDAIADVKAALEAVTQQIASLEAATASAEDQIAYRTQERVKLNEDLANYRRDLTGVVSVRDDLSRRRSAQLGELSRLYDVNNSLRDQMSYQ